MDIDDIGISYFGSLRWNNKDDESAVFLRDCLRTSYTRGYDDAASKLAEAESVIEELVKALDFCKFELSNWETDDNHTDTTKSAHDLAANALTRAREYQGKKK